MGKGFFSFFFFFKDFIYLFDTERDHACTHKQGEQQAEGGEEAGSLLSGEPDVGLDPRTLGS